MFKYAFGKVRQESDEAAALDQAPIDVETQVQAQEGQEIIKEVVELSDAIESYAEVAEKVGDIQQAHEVQVQVMDGDASVVDGSIKNEDDVTINVDAKEVAETAGVDGEILDTKATDAQADDAAAKLESDMNAVLAGIGATLRSSKFSKSGGILSSRVESDFNLRGKRGYRARVEGISEVGKKVWESIKAFFAKIWDFLKGLFERFTALFKSNKSVLETLKKKLESEDDDKYSNFNTDKEVPQHLAVFTELKDFVKHVVKTPSEVHESVKLLTSKAKDGGADSVASKFGIKSIGDKNDSYQAGGNLLSLLNGSTVANERSLKGFFYGAAGATSEGLLVWGFHGGSGKSKDSDEVGYKFITGTIKIKSPKKFANAKSGARDMLIDVCTDGIEMCEELEGKLIKTAKKDFDEIKKDAEELIKEVYDKDSKDSGGDKSTGYVKNSEDARAVQRSTRTALTTGVSTFSKVIATLGNQPSMYVSAVRAGMGLYSPSKD